MVDLGSEVSSKIRLAIKAKLKELNAYVDEELPDYIMVMVANKKPADQMKMDLGLFLNDHTEAFVDWLQKVLAKLEKVTLSGGGGGGSGTGGGGKTKDVAAAAKKVVKKKKASEGDESKKKKVAKVTKKKKKDVKSKEASVDKDRRSHSVSVERRLRHLAGGDTSERHRDRGGGDSSCGGRYDSRPQGRLSHEAVFVSRGRTQERRREHNYSPSLPSSSSFGSSRESAYDPERLLKKALVSEGQETKKEVKPQLSKRLSDQSMEEPSKGDSKGLNAVFAKRAKLSQAMKEGKLDERKIEEINRSLLASAVKRATQPQPKAPSISLSRDELQRRRSAKAEGDKSSNKKRAETGGVPRSSKGKSKSRERSKREQSSSSSPSPQRCNRIGRVTKKLLLHDQLGHSDLRHALLGAKKAKKDTPTKPERKTSRDDEEEYLKEAKAILADPKKAKASGITIQICNNVTSSSSTAPHIPVISPIHTVEDRLKEDEDNGEYRSKTAVIIKHVSEVQCQAPIQRPLTKELKRSSIEANKVTVEVGRSGTEEKQSEKSQRAKMAVRSTLALKNKAIM